MGRCWAVLVCSAQPHSFYNSKERPATEGSQPQDSQFDLGLGPRYSEKNVTFCIQTMADLGVTTSLFYCLKILKLIS